MIRMPPLEEVARAARQSALAVLEALEGRFANALAWADARKAAALAALGSREPRAGAAAGPRHYLAFLSYSHKDTKDGAWLHRALEQYNVPRRLIKERPEGALPSKLRPVFRDRFDYAAGASLGEKTRAALAHSRHLIVLCSPHAAQSRYVNEEIRLFKMMGGEGRIIPVILAGEPGDPRQECFPPALRTRYSADGEALGPADEPLAADLREIGDGRKLGRLKVIAGLLGLGLDDLVARDREAERARLRFAYGLVALFAFLAVGGTSAAYIAYKQTLKSEARLEKAIDIASSIVEYAVDQASQFGVPRKMTEGLLLMADRQFKELLADSQSGKLQERYAQLLVELSRHYQIVGDPDAELEKAQEALAIRQKLLQADPGNRATKRQLGVSWDLMGDVHLEAGQLGAALDAYQAAKTIADELAVLDRSDKQAQRDYSVALGKVAWTYRVNGRFDEAMAAYQDDLKFAQALADRYPADLQLKRDLAVCFEEIGDAFIDTLNSVLGAQMAQQMYESGEQKLAEIAREAPGNAEAQFDLMGAYDKVGNARMGQSDVVGARKKYEAARAIADALVKDDPGNARWRYALALILLDISESYVAMPQTADAGKALSEATAARAILEDLVSKANANMDWRLMLGRSEQQIGEALAVEGDFIASLDAFEKSGAILKSLADANSENTALRTQHFESERMAAIVAERAAKPDRAVMHYRAALAIIDAMLKAAPGDPNLLATRAAYAAAIDRLSDKTVLLPGGN